MISSMSNLQPNWCLKIDFQKVDQHPGGKWLIHDTKLCKDNQLQIESSIVAFDTSDWCNFL